MLMGALAIFTLVAVMGASMLANAWRGLPIEPIYPVLHGLAALAGSALVIVSALGGDTRLYLNIGMAVVIIALGALMGLMAKKGKKAPRGILVAHVGLAVVCYGVLGFFTLNPQAALL